MSKKTDEVDNPPREVNKHGVPVADGPPDQAPADNSSQGRYHGYTDAQVARIEFEKDPPPAQPTAASEAVPPGTEEQPNDPSAEAQLRAITEHDAALDDVDAWEEEAEREQHQKRK